MNHSEAKDCFSEYAEGTLKRAQKRQVEDHLEQCPACRADYEAFARAMAQLAGLGSHPPTVPPDFLAGVQGEIRRRSRGRFFMRKAPRFPLEMVSLITLLILLAIYLFFVVTQPSTVHEGAPPGGASGTHP